MGDWEVPPRERRTQQSPIALRVAVSRLREEEVGYQRNTLLAQVVAREVEHLSMLPQSATAEQSVFRRQIRVLTV